ncbi:hypothetical protein Leryth_010684 [Lithospermum erythrorhizon]|nr:hypothetical protein Leryth_010684 [Lithospermum erythrorhizon]
MNGSSSGTIPSNISSRSLTTLNLQFNHLRGNIPSSLAKCVNLKVLDLGNNNLNASFPSWLGVLLNLTVLNLRSNRFHGKVLLSTTSSFSKLQILDLSRNQFIGTLPPMLFQSFSSMMEIDQTGKAANYMGDDYVYYKDSTTLVNKGIETELVRILTTWTTIDLSSNNFEGNIPNSVGSLRSLRQLNFSNNRLTGEIPISFENLSVLESLDISSNQLTGTIPKRLTTLHFLSKLNLAHNHLTGRILVGTQFQTFESDSYIDNDGLCGIPLSETCEGDKDHVVDYAHDSDFFDGFGWRCVLIGYGVGTVLGLWIGFLMIQTETPEWLIIMIESICRI